MQNIREKIKVKNDIVEYVIIGAILAHLIEGILICTFLLLSQAVSAQCNSIPYKNWYAFDIITNWSQCNGGLVGTPTSSGEDVILDPTNVYCTGNVIKFKKPPIIHQPVCLYEFSEVVDDNAFDYEFVKDTSCLTEWTYIGQDINTGAPLSATVAIRIYPNDTLSTVEYTCDQSLIGTNDTVLTTAITDCGCPVYIIVSYEEQIVDVVQEDIELCNGDLLFLNKYNCSYVSPYSKAYDVVDFVATPKDHTGMWTIKSNLDGCYAEADFWIEVHPTPVLVMSDVVVCQNTATKIFPSYANSNYGLEYEWKDSNEVVSRFDTLRLIEPTNSMYWLKITNTKGCSALDSAIVYEEMCCEKYIKEHGITMFAPNSFSPNNDGINDMWTLYGDPKITINRVDIFDRLGSLIYRKENFTLADEGLFSGDFKNILLQPQVLVYSIQATVENCPFKREGDITLLK